MTDLPNIEHIATDILFIEWSCHSPRHLRANFAHLNRSKLTSFMILSQQMVNRIFFCSYWCWWNVSIASKSVRKTENLLRNGNFSQVYLSICCVLYLYWPRLSMYGGVIWRQDHHGIGCISKRLLPFEYCKLKDTVWQLLIQAL